jgi:outer membrane protein OmpA-like peptidoglycan-associated protein
MNRSTLGALIILVLGLVGVGGFYGYQKLTAGQAEVAQSDSKVNMHLRVGGDPYVGYFFMRSPEMKRQAAKRGIAVDFTDDGGDYAARLQKFNDGKYDAIVLPINSYLTHGQKYNYPGVIVSAIAGSKGADAMACFTGTGTKLPADPKVQDLNDASLKIVYTAESPSSFLLDLAIADFDLFNLRKTDTWRDEVSGSDKAYQKAQQHQGDCFVMWEPDLTRALNGDIPGLKKVWGSDKFGGYIVDVFVFRRDFLANHHDAVVSFFESYFQSMRAYAGDRNRMVSDVMQLYGLKKTEVEAVLKEIHWYDLQENAARQFGITSGVAGGNVVEGVVNTINASTDVLVRTGKLAQDPLSGDPYKIVSSSVLKDVQAQLPKEIGSSAVKRQFSQLSESDWKALREIGVMRVEPINFQAGTAQLNAAGEAQVDKIAEMLVNNYPDARVVVRGHTGKGSDEDANVALSQDRAEVVMQRLVAVAGLDPNRVRAEGMGSSQPPQKRPGENPREYQYRIPRVEFTLYEDVSSF